MGTHNINFNGEIINYPRIITKYSLTTPTWQSCHMFLKVQLKKVYNKSTAFPKQVSVFIKSSYSSALHSSFSVCYY